MNAPHGAEAASPAAGPSADAPTGPVPVGPASVGPVPPASPEAGWQRLDRRMLVVHPALDLGRLLPLVALVVVTGGSADDRWRIVGSVVVAVLVLGTGALRWVATTYRITPERVELRTGLLRRHHRSVHRDRIRTADLTSTLLHRVFGLAVVRIGTGSQDGGEDAELRLDAVGHTEAERLRRVLLGTRPRVATPPGGTAASPAGEDAAGEDAAAEDDAAGVGVEVARWHAAWVRFAPLTFSALAVVGALLAAVFRIVDEFGLGLDDARRLRPLGTLGLVLGGVGLVVVAVVGAGVLVAESWWAYRLTRTDDGGLVVRRGLLTRRSLTLSGHRLRGAELDEPLLLRLGRGARPLALTSGLRARGEGEHVGALAPAVPRAEAHRIVAAALGTSPGSGTAAALVRHPPAATTRRWVRALGPATGLAAVVVVASVLGGSGAGAPSWAAVGVTVAVVAAGVGLGAARTAALGHALTATHLVSRHGALVRRTVVLRREGVIGWRVHQSLMQRRVGLVTLVAVSAAGRGRYEVLDVGVDRALELVAAVTPELLDGFTRTITGASGALTTRAGG